MFPSDNEVASLTAWPWNVVILYPLSKMCCGSSAAIVLLSNSILCVSLFTLRARADGMAYDNLSTWNRLRMTV